MVLFDLPTLTPDDRRAYRIFRKALINEGFLMMQESVYVRIATSRPAAEMLEKRIAKFIPGDGLIQTLIITEKQYTSMRFLVGESSDDLRNVADKVIVI
jgi:CRISPR-associated protein Cas2